jgi:hypothetical protein
MSLVMISGNWTAVNSRCLPARPFQSDQVSVIQLPCFQPSATAPGYEARAQVAQLPSSPS